MPTLLEICQDSLEEIGGYEVPALVIGNNNQTAKDILAQAKRALRMLVDAHQWSALVVEASFTTVSSQEEYDLPSDFDRLLDATWWDRTNRWRVHGPATPQEWQALKARDLSASIRKWFRIRKSGNARKILLYPTPTNSTDNIRYEYRSRHPVFDTSGTTHETWQADTDQTVLDAELLKMGIIWRFLKAKGLPYAEEMNDYELSLELATANDGGKRSVNLLDERFRDPLNIPETGFGQ